MATTQITSSETLTENLNNFIPTGFKFFLDKIPNVSYFCQAASLPGITAGQAILPNPLRDISVAGDKAQFNEFRIRFIIDEELKNWLEIYNWIVGLTYPEDTEQYKKLYKSGNSLSSFGGLYSDGSLYILSSHKNAQYKVDFTHLFPITLTDIDMDSSLGDIDAITADVSFQYTTYNINRLIGDF